MRSSARNWKDLAENFSRRWICYPFETWKIRRFEVDRRFLKILKMLHHLILQGYFGQVLLRSPKCSFYFSAKFRSASLESTLLLIWYGRAKKTFRWPCLESRSGTPVNFIYHSNILDLQSDFFMLFSYWQNQMPRCIRLIVNLLTWRKVSPVFYWKSESFIPSAHDIY